MGDANTCLLILAVTIALFVWNRLPVEIVALGSALALYLTGVLPFADLFSGFGDPVIPFVAALFVVSEGLGAAGVTAWIGGLLAARSGGGKVRLVVVMMVLAAALTALISVNGTTAALLPVVVLLAVRLGMAPSRLAIPLAFAGHAGSLLVLTASPINVLVSEAAAEAGGRPFGFFEFALAGIPLVAGTIAVCVLLGDRLLPARTPRSLPPDLSGHSRTLITHYRLDAHTTALTVPPGSPAVGGPAESLPPPILGAVGPDRTALRPGTPLKAGDILIASGDPAALTELAEAYGLRPTPDAGADRLAATLLTRDHGVAELVLGPRSPLAGDTVYPGMATDSGELVVLAVARGGQTLPHTEAAVLESGDVLLLRGSWNALDRAAGDGDLLVVDAPASVRRQAVPLGPGSRTAVTILAAMVVLLATGVVPPSVAALLAAGAMVVTRVITMRQAYAGISWTTLVIVAGMFPMSLAMQRSGAADRLADIVVGPFGGNAILLLLGLFLLTALLGQVISNMATALIVIPIAVAAAADVGVPLPPVLMCVAIASAAAFLTPIATAANLMVKEPGGYRFGDYWPLGAVCLAWFGVVGVGLVPLIWGIT
ncbi:SLC13 family permease [Phytomonospora sp. NPDC050363]|uniref:SLC13 family permease n=1 Tax=Phytomonospora sp. NPDC050363 TaxID=3155642 RepID=UPI0033DE183D